MSVHSHIEELRRRHESLSELVEREQRSPGVDALRVSELKKQKLHLKQEITRLGLGAH